MGGPHPGRPRDHIENPETQLGLRGSYPAKTHWQFGRLMNPAIGLEMASHAPGVHLEPMGPPRSPIGGG
jgi:hypothetical protein